MENITIEELKAGMDSGENINLLYVREPDEYAAFSDLSNPVSAEHETGQASP